MLSAATDPAHRAAARELLVWCDLIEGRMADAMDGLRDLPLESSAHELLHPEVLRAAGGTEAAVDLLRKAFATSPEADTGRALIRGLLEAGLADEALALVTGPHADAPGPDAALLVTAALFRSGRLEEAATVGERCFDRRPHAVVAYNLACTRARQGRADEAMTWLDRALDEGFVEADAIDGDPDLARLRGTPRFDAIRARAQA